MIPAGIRTQLSPEVQGQPLFVVGTIVKVADSCLRYVIHEIKYDNVPGVNVTFYAKFDYTYLIYPLGSSEPFGWVAQQELRADDNSEDSVGSDEVTVSTLAKKRKVRFDWCQRRVTSATLASAPIF